MTFGAFFKGDNSNLLIDPDNPVMAAAASGPLNMTKTNTTYRAYGPGGYYIATTVEDDLCYVTFPTPIATVQPPMVFASPGHTATGSLSAFRLTGGPGNWTGFTVCWQGAAVLKNPQRIGEYAAQGGPTIVSKTLNALVFTGWHWAAVMDYAPPGPGTWGMKVNDGIGRTIFDSRWNLLLFRGLLGGWSIGSPHIWRIWGDKSLREITQPFFHDLTVPIVRGKTAFVMNNLGAFWALVDTSTSDEWVRFECMFGLDPGNANNRLKIQCYIPQADHYGPTASPLNAMQIFWGEFSRSIID